MESGEVINRAKYKTSVKDPGTLGILKMHWTSIQELVRHFWSSYPITCSHLYAKVNRLKDAMSQIYPQLEEIKKSVPANHKQHVPVLVRQMHQALDAAFQHCYADIQK